MAGYTIPIIVTGSPAIEAAVAAIQNLDTKTNSFVANQVRSAEQLEEATKKATKAIHDQRIAYAQTEAADKRAKKATPAGSRAPAPKLSADGAAFLAIVRDTERAQRIFDGFSFTKLEQEYKRTTLEVRRYNTELAQVASANRIALNEKTALLMATERETLANQNVKAAIAAIGTEQAKETRLLKLQYAELEKALTINEKRTAAFVAQKNELEYANSLEGRLAEKAKYATRLAQEAAIATDKRAEAQRRLNELRSGGPAAEDARLSYQIRLANELAIADLKLVESKRVLAALGRPDSIESETAAIARQTAETKRLTASKQELAALRNPASNASQQAALDAQISAQRELVRLRAEANISPNDRREITALTEKAKLEQERARLLARSTREFRALEAEVVRLRHAEERAINPTKSLSMHLNLANQGAAALRSSIYGMGASFGVFTSSTVLIAASVYAVSRAFREGVTAAIDYEQKLAALGAMASRSSGISPEYAADKEKLNQAAMGAALSSKYSTLEVADAMKQLALAGLTVDQSIAATIPTMRLATIGQLGFAEAADIATNIMMGFGKEVEQLPNIIDVLAKAATESNTDVTQLGNAMSYAAPVANAFGVSLEYTAAAMEVLANAGIKSSRAGTGMRRIFVSLFTPTQKITDAVSSFGISLGKVAKEGESLEGLEGSVGKLIDLAGGAEEAQRMLEEFYIATAGGTKNLQLFRDTVGVYALQSMTQLVKSVGMGTKSIQAFEESLKDLEGTAEQQSAKMLDNLKDTWGQIGAASSVLSAKLYDEEKSGLRTMLEHLLAIARSLAQSAKVAAPFTAAIKALGEAVIRVVAILAGLKLAFLGISTVALLFSKTTAAVKNLGLALDWLKARYIGLGVAAAGAAASSQAAATAGAAGATAGAGGILASLGVSGLGLITGGAIIAGVLATVYAIYKQFSGVGEAVGKVNDAFAVMKQETDAYNQSLQQTYDRLAGGDLVKLYEERARLEGEMLDLSGKTVEQTKQLKKEYADVNKEIVGAHKSLKEFGSTTLLLDKVKKQGELDTANTELAEAKASIEELERKRAVAVKMLGYGLQRGLEGPAGAKYLDKDLARINAAKEALELQKARVAVLATEIAVTDRLQKILTNGTALDQAKELGVLQASLTAKIIEQEAAVAKLSKEVAAGDEAKAARLAQEAAALDRLRSQRAQIANMEQTTRQLEMAGAIPYEQMMAQHEKARQQHLESQRLINGTEQERADAALAAAEIEKNSAQARVTQLETIHAALKELMETEKDAARQRIYQEALFRTGADLAGAYGPANESVENYNRALKASTGLQTKTAKDMGGVIKSAAELHQQMMALIKDLADFKRGFTELNEEILSKGTEVFSDMTQHAKALSGALREVTLSGAEVAGLEMPNPSQAPQAQQALLPGKLGGLAPEFGAQLQQMISDAAEEGIRIGVTSGLRTFKQQKDIFATARKGYAAPPGRSYHEKGLAADLSYGPGAQAWAHANAAKYGLKFPMQSSKLNEPWHIEPMSTRGGASLAGQNLANIDQSKSVTYLIRDEEALAKAKAETAAQSKVQYDAMAHLNLLMQNEVTTYAEAKEAYAESYYWQEQIRAGRQLDVTQTAAATDALSKANATWKSYTAAHEAALTAEEEGIRLGDLKAIQVSRSSSEMEKLKEQYITGDAAMKDYNYTLAMNNFLLGKGVLTLEQYRQNMSDAARAVAQAKGSYAGFWDSLRYDAKKFEEIGTGVMTSFRDSIAEALASGKMDFEKFLNYLRDAAAKFAADKIMEALFKPADDSGAGGGLLSAAVSVISKGIMSYFNNGAAAPAANATGGVYSTSLPSGVYRSPTLFPYRSPGLHAFATGTGLLGEAGPEAVLPLTRVGGDLGVKAQTTHPKISVTVNNLPGQTANVKQDGNNLSIDIIEQVLASRISKGGSPMSKGLESTYAGMRRQGR